MDKASDIPRASHYVLPQKGLFSATHHCAPQPLILNWPPSAFSPQTNALVCHNTQAGLLTVGSLAANIHLKELTLMGNPCTEWSGYRPYVVAKLPQLKKLVGRYESLGQPSSVSKPADCCKRDAGTGAGYGAALFNAAGAAAVGYLPIPCHTRSTQYISQLQHSQHLLLHGILTTLRLRKAQRTKHSFCEPCPAKGPPCRVPCTFCNLAAPLPERRTDCRQAAADQ